jgi:hypothetical protein
MGMKALLSKLRKAHSVKGAGWVVVALIVANEIRGLFIVATVGVPMLKAMW